MFLRTLFSGALIAAASIGSAQATVITQTYYVTVSDFLGGPISSLTQQFTLTFEPSVTAQNLSVTNCSSSSALAAFAGPVAANTAFMPWDGTTSVVVGGSLNGSSALVHGTNDFATLFTVDGNGALVSGYVPTVLYTLAGESVPFQSRTATISITPPGSVPEPATWAMMLAGFGVVAFAMRRRARQTVCLNFA